MPIKLKGGGTLNIRNFERADFPSVLIDYQAVKQYVSGGTTAVVTEADAEITRVTGATYYNGGFVAAVADPTEFTLVNKTPSIATIGEDGSINRVSPGTSRLVLQGKISIPLNIDLGNKGGTINPSAVAVAGSLAKHCHDQVNSRVGSSMTMAANGMIFSSLNHNTQIYNRNANLWCADVDLTCASPWNSDFTNSNTSIVNRKFGTLITPMHVIGAKHQYYEVGKVLRFIAGDNTIHTREIVGKKDYSSADITIYTLDRDVPAAITPCKVLPADWGDYMANNHLTLPPALSIDQEQKALISSFISARDSYHGTLALAAPADTDQAIFNESKVSGDSGGPSFLIVNGELVLIMTFQYGGGGQGPIVSKYIAEINQMIIDSDSQTGLSTGYTVTEADFSAFPSY
jgi:hypothetical protein